MSLVYDAHPTADPDAATQGLPRRRLAGRAWRDPGRFEGSYTSFTTPENLAAGLAAPSAGLKG